MGCYIEPVASLADRLPENVDGDWFVDSTCIDCETCMIVAPSVFAESARSMSFVHHQPVDPRESLRARMALISCPTSSIGTVKKGAREEGLAAAAAFPEAVDADAGVYYCGYAHEGSYGASAYLVVRDGGRANVLVDSPRAAGPLLKRIETLGGVKTMFLTHRDDIADHEAFHERFGCERILHAADVTRDTRNVERKIEGNDPVRLADDLVVIPTPGHSRGSAVLLYRETFLFTGDHLWGTADGKLDASAGVSWYSWDEQLKSMEKLLDVPFEWVLPGHGRPWRAPSREAARAELAALVSRMKRR